VLRVQEGQLLSRYIVYAELRYLFIANANKPSDFNCVLLCCCFSLLKINRQVLHPTSKHQRLHVNQNKTIRNSVVFHLVLYYRISESKVVKTVETKYWRIEKKIICFFEYSHTLFVSEVT